jgi:hypothetical protein
MDGIARTKIVVRVTVPQLQYALQDIVELFPDVSACFVCGQSFSGRYNRHQEGINCRVREFGG